MYCEPFDLLTDIPVLHLIALVNDENRPPLEYTEDGDNGGWTFYDPDDDTGMRVLAACYDAAAAIDPYLVERFKLPLAGPCPKLNKIARTLALSYLFNRRGIIYSVDFAKNLERAITDLENIRDGKLLVPELESLLTPIRNISNKVSTDQFLSSDFINHY
jgi:hypothetical protein